MSSLSNELTTLLDQVDAQLEYEGNPQGAAEVRPKLEEFAGTYAENNPRYLLLRGLARYLDDDVEDERAREDYLAALEAARGNPSMEIRALCRLAQLDHFHKRFDLAGDWLETAASRVRADTPHSARGEVALRNAQLLADAANADAGQAYLEAARAFQLAGIAPRWLTARFGALNEAWFASGAPSSAQVDTVCQEGETMGVTPSATLSKLGRLVIEAYFGGRKRGAAELAVHVSEHELPDLPADERAMLGRLLWMENQPERANHIFDNISSDLAASEEDRWFSSLLAVAGRLESGQVPVDALEETVASRPTARARPKQLLMASKFLLDWSRPLVAMEVCREILDCPTATNRERTTAAVNLGGSLINLGELQAAREVLDGVDARNLACDSELQAVLQLNRANVAANEGLWEVAFSCADAVLIDLRAAGDHHQLAVALANTLTWSAIAGDSNSERKYSDELIELLPCVSGKPRASALLAVAGHLHRYTRRRQLVRNLLREAISVADELGDTRIACTALFQFALWCPEDSTQAGRLLRLVLRHRHAAPDLAGFALGGLGLIAAPRNTEDALRFFMRAALAHRTLGRKDEEADNWDSAAICAPDLNTATALGERALRASLQLVAVVADPHLREQVLARLRPIGASQVFRYVAHGDLERALQTAYLTKAGAFLRMTPGTGGLSHDASLALNAAMRFRIDSVTLSPFGGMSLRHGAPFSAPAVPSLAAIVRTNRSVADLRVKAQAVQNRLGRNDAAVEYFLDTNSRRLTIFIVTPLEIRVFTRRWTRGLAEATEGIADGLAGRRFGGDLRWLTAKLRDLHDVLVGPLGGLPGRVERLWVALGGLLSGIPFMALLDRSGIPLLERADIRMLVTTAQLALLPRRRKLLRRALVLRGSDEGSAGLLHANSECARISSRLHELGIYVGDDASIDVRRTDLLHYAGHAEFRDGDGTATLALPGLNFTDESLARLPFERRPLLVLSACESGRMNTGFDGFTGFLRGAFAAGARDVICSGWPADDAATAVLMDRFYVHLFSGLSPAPALRAAAQELRADPAFAHPFFWANFRCYGVG